MTPEPPHPDHDLDQWLTTTKADLLTSLDNIVDLDTGLTDATLTTRANTTITSLDNIVDLDTGLTHILPTPTTTPSNPSDGQPATSSPLTQYAHQFAAQPAAQRLAARAWFPTPLLDLALDLASARTLTLTLGRVHIHALARALARALDHARALAHPRALDYALDLDHALAHPRDLARARDLDRALIRDLIRDLAHVQNDAFGLTHDRNRNRLDQTLKTVRLGINTAHARAIHLARDRARKHDLALHDALQPALACVDAEAVRLDLAGALPLLENALTDATGADLTDADLHNISLEGVIWSTGPHGTRWPRHLEHHVIQNSIPIGPDLHQITKFHTGNHTPTNLTV